jgi:hypothetical protein
LNTNPQNQAVKLLIPLNLEGVPLTIPVLESAGFEIFGLNGKTIKRSDARLGLKKRLQRVQDYWS